MWFPIVASLIVAFSLTGSSARWNTRGDGASLEQPYGPFKQTTRNEIVRRNLRPPKPRRSASPPPTLYRLNVVGTTDYIAAPGSCGNPANDPTYCNAVVLSGVNSADRFYIDSSGRLVDYDQGSTFAVADNSGYYPIVFVDAATQSTYGIDAISCSFSSGAMLLTCGFPGSASIKILATTSNTANELLIADVGCGGLSDCQALQIQGVAA